MLGNRTIGYMAIASIVYIMLIILSQNYENVVSTPTRTIDVSRADR